jgi:hypothetical protein
MHFHTGSKPPTEGSEGESGTEAVTIRSVYLLSVACMRRLVCRCAEPVDPQFRFHSGLCYRSAFFPLVLLSQYMACHGRFWLILPPPNPLCWTRLDGEERDMRGSDGRSRPVTQRDPARGRASRASSTSIWGATYLEKAKSESFMFCKHSRQLYKPAKRTFGNSTRYSSQPADNCSGLQRFGIMTSRPSSNIFSVWIGKSAGRYLTSTMEQVNPRESFRNFRLSRWWAPPVVSVLGKSVGPYLIESLLGPCWHEAKFFAAGLTDNQCCSAQTSMRLEDRHEQVEGSQGRGTT